MTIADLRDFMLRNPGPHSYATIVGLASRHGVRNAVTAGEVVRVLPDQYASSVHAQSWTVRIRAGLAWTGSSAAIDGLSALYVWGAADPPSGVHLVVAEGHHRQAPSWLDLRTASYQVDRWLSTRGEAVVSPAHAVIRAHALAPPRDRAEVVYRAFRTRIVTGAVLRNALDATPRVRHRAALMRTIEFADAGVESFLEERAAVTVLQGRAFDGLVRQHLVRTDAGRFRLDAFDPTTLTAIEFDGDGTHASAPARLADLRRDVALARIGILTLRFSYRDITDRPDWCRESVTAVIGSRASGT